ncbi:hypothetical protein EJ06DRAFT_88005 [Trichodelitschia bisporula]|uniref:K Homology domain-containing protein n=1 Tax=Trichodelitschia bisporula TaxID=703511 RepID=A0A6G1HS21_9PEZI|nr:hypothetical protein EJ06DRAFT_88005 [Trichodelitschia bisporula]
MVMKPTPSPSVDATSASDPAPQPAVPHGFRSYTRGVYSDAYTGHQDVGREFPAATGYSLPVRLPYPLNNRDNFIIVPPSEPQPSDAKPAAAQQPLQEDDREEQMMVPDRTIGLIVGRGGQTIADLQQRSGCDINILGAHKSNNGLRPINIIGPVAYRAAAKELIMEIVDNERINTLPQATAPPNPTELSQALATSAPPSEPPPRDANPAAAQQPLQEDENQEQIMVPHWAFGLLGLDSQTFADLRERSGCGISIIWADEDINGLRPVINLIGTEANRAYAKELIMDIIDNAGLNTAPQATAPPRPNELSQESAPPNYVAYLRQYVAGVRQVPLAQEPEPPSHELPVPIVEPHMPALAPGSDPVVGPKRGNFSHTSRDIRIGTSQDRTSQNWNCTLSARCRCVQGEHYWSELSLNRWLANNDGTFAWVGPEDADGNFMASAKVELDERIENVNGELVFMEQ